MTRNKGPQRRASGPNLRMETDLEADPILRSSEGRASPLQIGLFSLIFIVIIGVVAWAVS